MKRGLSSSPASERWICWGRAAPDLRFDYPFGGLTLGERLRWYEERLQVRQRLLLRR
jgi:hypothetical protein